MTIKQKKPNIREPKEYHRINIEKLKDKENKIKSRVKFEKRLGGKYVG